MKTRILAACCCAVACVLLLAGCGKKANVNVVLESSIMPAQPQSETAASPKISSQVEASEPESNEEELSAPELEETIETGEREEPANYIYDEASGNLLLTDFNLQFTVPAEAMERLELKTLDAFGNGMIIHIDFNYKTENGSYRMFLVSVWDADEWDNQNKKMGPLPIEIARSVDGKKTALYASSSLAAQNPANNDENKIFWKLIDENEKAIIDSVKFI